MRTDTLRHLHRAVAALCLCAALAPRARAAEPAPDPEAERRSFKVADGFEVSLFAADPMLVKPIAMNFDAAGRLWVASSETYPQVRPGDVPDDKIFVLEDTDGDGRADKSTTFAGGLLIPTAVVPGDGGAYVSNSTELVFLKDTDGDGKADTRRVVLAGFGTEDTHHILHTFRWGPDGRLYFGQSIYIHSQLETPRGLKKLDGGGVWRLRPDSMELDVFFTGLVNGWGYVWTDWGQTFATDGAGTEGINYVVPGANFTATPNVQRVLPGLNPGSPKYCGVEVLSGRGLPADVQGDLLTNDFRANRVVRFKLANAGAGFEAKLMPDFITSSDKAFRPVDIKMGPDGAIYIADWYNPIIQHGEVDFRDPRRDKSHGRIWRVTAKNHPPLVRPALAPATVDQLLEFLLSPEGYTRQQAKNVLRERGAKEVAPALSRWVKGLAQGRPGTAFDADHARLEALWAYQGIDTVEPGLLKELIASSNPNARAAAARVAGQWAAQLDKPADLLAPLAADDSPRVRMEAARALAAVATPEAVTIALRALDKPVDPVLDYALFKTAVDLGSQWLPAFQAGKLTGWADPKHLTFALRAVKSPDALKVVVAQLRDGQTPAGGRKDVYDLIAATGSAADVGVVWKQALDAKTDAPTRVAALQAIERAARQRKVTPAGLKAAELLALFIDRNDALAAAALRLAGALKLPDVRSVLEDLLADSGRAPAVGFAAAEALAAYGPDAAAPFLRLAGDKTDPLLRVRAIVGLAAVDVKQAAGPAAELLAAGLKPGGEPNDILAAFLKRQGGAEALAAAMKAKPPQQDLARLSLRYLQGVGQNAPALTEILRQSAGVTGQAQPPSPDEMRRLVADVATQGDPARGENVFRSQAAGCYLCHAVGGVGGPLAPDLRSIGAASPVDYLVDSILVPNKAIKDGYDSVLVSTRDGDVIQGIKVREDAAELVLRDNLRDEITIPVPAIKSRRPGGSLMPQGLADTLTRGEFLDLVRFLSELGKPGPFAVPTSPVVRRWQVVEPAGADILPAPDAAWKPAYALVSGALPADALPPSPGGAAFARCQVEVTAPGKVGLRVNAPQGTKLWVDDVPVPTVGPEIVLDFARGVRTLTFRLDPAKLGAEGARVELGEVPGSTGRARPVEGR